MSRGFLCVLFGLAVSVSSWYVPFAFPSWPSAFVVRVLAGRGIIFQDLANTQRTIMFIALLVINSAFWAIAAWLVWRIAARLSKRRA